MWKKSVFLRAQMAMFEVYSSPNIGRILVNGMQSSQDELLARDKKFFSRTKSILHYYHN